MVKIFVNNVTVYLFGKKEEQYIAPFSAERNALHINYSDKDSLLALIEKAEQSTTHYSVFIAHEDADELLKIFSSLYKLHPAAGGVVKNKREEVLMIYRRGKWDLPKGKIEKHETIKQAALREVQEETGLKNLSIVEPVIIYPWKQSCTYHTYFEKGKRILKDTYWFVMSSTDTEPPVPQTEEEITETVWTPEQDIPELMNNSYPSVADVLSYAV